MGFKMYETNQKYKLNWTPYQFIMKRQYYLYLIKGIV
ncbi:hypothetical protein EVA_22272 [gut metagenome]|uniref:Uncharacterized protein n=1 Tax=gut metagenome TaxID=749906 RepID=J9F3Z9_9ZZZZ